MAQIGILYCYCLHVHIQWYFDWWNAVALCMLHSVHILHSQYVTCYCALMYWYWEHKNRKSYIFLSNFTNFPFICEVLASYSDTFGYINILLLTIMLTQIPHFYCSGVFSHPWQLFILQYYRWVNPVWLAETQQMIDDSHLYQTEVYLVSFFKYKSCLVWDIITFLISCDLSNSGFVLLQSWILDIQHMSDITDW